MEFIGITTDSGVQGAGGTTVNLAAPADAAVGDLYMLALYSALPTFASVDGVPDGSPSDPTLDWSSTRGDGGLATGGAVMYVMYREVADPNADVVVEITSGAGLGEWYGVALVCYRNVTLPELGAGNSNFSDDASFGGSFYGVGVEYFEFCIMATQNSTLFDWDSAIITRGQVSDGPTSFRLRVGDTVGVGGHDALPVTVDNGATLANDVLWSVSFESPLPKDADPPTTLDLRLEKVKETEPPYNVPTRVRDARRR